MVSTCTNSSGPFAQWPDGVRSAGALPAAMGSLLLAAGVGDSGRWAAYAAILVLWGIALGTAVRAMRAERDRGEDTGTLAAAPAG